MCTILVAAYIHYVYYVGDLVIAIENNDEIAAGSSDRIWPDQAGNYNDHCQYYVIARQWIEVFLPLTLH